MTDIDKALHDATDLPPHPVPLASIERAIRRSTRRRRLLACAGAVIVLAGTVPVALAATGKDGADRLVPALAASAPPPAAPRSTAAVVPDDGEDSPVAVLAGTLAGDAGSGCLWVQGGQPQVRTPVLLKGDYSVDFAAVPPRLYLGDVPVAGFGDPVSIGGGFGDPPDLPGCPVPGRPLTGLLNSPRLPSSDEVPGSSSPTGSPCPAVYNGDGVTGGPFSPDAPRDRLVPAGVMSFTVCAYDMATAYGLATGMLRETRPVPERRTADVERALEIAPRPELLHLCSKLRRPRLVLLATYPDRGPFFVAFRYACERSLDNGAFVTSLTPTLQKLLDVDTLLTETIGSGTR